MTNYFKLLAFLKPHKKLFASAVVSMFVASFFEVIQITLLIPLVDRIFNNQKIEFANRIPHYLQPVIEYLNAPHDPFSLLRQVLAVFIVLLLIKHVVVYLYRYLMNDVAQSVIRDIRQKLYAKIQTLSLDYFSEKKTGELVARVTYDVNLIENAISYSVTDLFRQLFMVIFYLYLAFTIHFKAAFIILIVFPLIIWPITVIGGRLRQISKTSQERMADIHTILMETISGVKLVKAFCTEIYEIARFRGINQAIYKLRMKSVKRVLFTTPITEIFGGFCAVLIMFWLGPQVIRHEMSFAVFGTFLASILLMISPLKKIGNVNAIIQQALAANDRIYEVLDLEPSVKERPDARDVALIQKSIEFQNVSFRYEKNLPDVLNDINLKINTGELVAIVGPTGTGKSTLVNLIPRFYDPQQGRILIDGDDVREATFKSLRRQIGIVSQEAFLFNDTVRSNIAYGHPEATQEEIEEAAKKAYAHNFIMKMPRQYDTIIGDRGFRLSGGEKQRLTIARAIIKNAPILILDEATSQLDSESERFVQEALDALMEGRTAIVIALRLSTIQKADKIVVLENGRIVGQAPHNELLKSCELYTRLYKTQFQGA